MIIPMRTLAATIVATALPALPATAHTGTPLMRAAGTAGHADAWPVSASAITPLSVLQAMEGAQNGTTIGAAAASNALAITVSPVAGRDAIVVDGTAPAALPVTITLTGTISRDIPTVTLGRITLATDGSFHATIPVAPMMPRGSVVTVTATSLPGVSPASARFTVGPPNPTSATRFDALPKD